MKAKRKRMNKVLIASIAILLLAMGANAENGDFVWAKAMGGTSDDSGEGIAVDDAGNVYTTGSFYGTVDFDPGPGSFNLTSTGFSDIFVSKLDSAGNFVWAKRMGGTDYDLGHYHLRKA